MDGEYLCVSNRGGSPPWYPFQKLSALCRCGFVLCVGLSYAEAAHPQAETDMSNDRGSQGNQDMIKGESGPAAEKDAQSGRKNRETKMKKDNSSAKQSTDHRNDKDQGATGEKSKVGH